MIKGATQGTTQKEASDRGSIPLTGAREAEKERSPFGAAVQRRSGF